MQLCSKITSLKQFPQKLLKIYIFLFSKPFEGYKNASFGTKFVDIIPQLRALRANLSLISLQNVVFWAIRKQKYIYFHIFWPASLPRPAASWATSLCYDFEFGRAPRGGQKRSTNTILLFLIEFYILNYGHNNLLSLSFGKTFVKTTFLLMNLLNSWFDEIFFRWE